MLALSEFRLPGSGECAPTRFRTRNCSASSCNLTDYSGNSSSVSRLFSSTRRRKISRETFVGDNASETSACACALMVSRIAFSTRFNFSRSLSLSLPPSFSFPFSSPFPFSHVEKTAGSRRHVRRSSWMVRDSRDFLRAHIIA